MSVVQRHKSFGQPQGGVGIAFEDRVGTCLLVKQAYTLAYMLTCFCACMRVALTTFEDHADQRTGGMLKIVAEVFSEGAAAEWNSSAKDTEKIHAGDLLVEVNGESVARCDMRMLSQMVPGPVGTPVVLRLRSVKGNQEFEVSAERHT